jgi:hypothetical protein
MPRRCDAHAAERRLLRLVRAYNVGDGRSFAAGFARSGQFHPYTATIRGFGFRGRTAIARFVAGRYEAGDGWTLRDLAPPTRRNITRIGIVGVGLRVIRGGATIAEGSLKWVLDCRTGFATGGRAFVSGCHGQILTAVSSSPAASCHTVWTRGTEDADARVSRDRKGRGHHALR